MYPSHNTNTNNSPHPGVVPSMAHPSAHAEYGIPQPGMHYTPAMRQDMLPAPPRPQHQTQVQPQRLSVSSQRGDLLYTLEVEQQPDRARMCGFGDKDRRPITPPPCVRLYIRNVKTGLDVDLADVDAQHFILNVDLWDAEATQEVNLVRHSNSSPSVSISMATTTSYPPPPEQTHHMVMIGGTHGQPASYRAMPLGSYYGGYGYQDGQQAGLMASHPVSAAGMFTRNLIGSVTVSAAALHDFGERSGLWFVLQDLSVRTEGVFRLKMSFVDVGSGTNGSLNTGHCPVLASVFSERFTVWSAKKFPGVKESTPLSKCFATQGVKIPIRKDGPKSGGRGGGGDDDDD